MLYINSAFNMSEWIPAV